MAETAAKQILVSTKEQKTYQYGFYSFKHVVIEKLYYRSKIKKNISIFEIGKNSVDISDTKAQTSDIARVVLNQCPDVEAIHVVFTFFCYTRRYTLLCNMLYVLFIY